VTLEYPEPPLSDGRVALRPWSEDDLPLVEKVSADDYIALIERIPAPYSAKGGVSWIARQQEQVVQDRGWSFAVVDASDNRPVGGTGITFRHPPGAAEPGIWVVADRRRCGIATRATKLLCSWALTSATGIERIQATVEPWNVASQRTLEKVGFQREGLLRSYASWNDERRDVLLYSLLASDLH
jgi:RimJ/RimL family protein N-acetyltransferase